MTSEDILKTYGLKKTAQRIRFIDILLQHGVALTEQEMMEEMGELYDRVTFYRTINRLIECGIIHRITIDNLTSKYALNMFHKSDSIHHHAHFFCKKCQEVICIDNTSEVNYKVPKGYEDEECEILIKGICAVCKK